MSKLKLIIAREYMSMVGRKSFIIMTILIPILMIACILLPIGIGYLNNGQRAHQTVAVIDETGRYGWSDRGHRPNSLRAPAWRHGAPHPTSSMPRQPKV